MLALHQPVDSLGLSEVVYYEDTGVDTLTVLWRYRLEADIPAHIVDAGVTDLDGDQLPEVTVLLHYQTLEDKSAPYWLQVFDWNSETGTFSTAPTFRWNYRGRGISYLRPRQMAVADLDVDGNDELVIAIGSPDRMVLIADWGPTGLQVYKELKVRETVSGPWPFDVAVADLNGDLRTDILIVGQGRAPEMLAYINGRYDFHAMSVTTTADKPVIPATSASGDLNGDGQEEIILPHTDGSLTLVSMAGPALRGVALDAEIPNLLDLAAIDLDGDGTSEIIYLQADGTITTNDNRFVTPVTGEEIRSRLPDGVALPLRCQSFVVFPASVKSPPVIVLPVHTDTGSFITLTEVGVPLSRQLPLPPYKAVQPTEPEALAEHEMVSRVYPSDRLLPSDARALPPHRTPDILLYVGQEFTLSVIGERRDESASFRFLTKAPGMIFNFLRQAIEWQPTAEHLGAWNVEYEIVYHPGVGPGGVVADSLVRVTPEAEVVRHQLLFYVNDKPRITSRPDNLGLLAGQPFAYRIQVEDRNADARIDYRLESGPEGMSIDPDGILSWHTNETHHDDYQVVISAGDGFDKNIQTFTLNVNAQLTITSTVPHVAHVQKPYSYQVTVFQPGSKKDQVFSLLRAPDGMSIDPSGLVSWTPTPVQIDTQYFQLQVTEGTAEYVQDGMVYVNAQPRLIDTPPLAVTILAGDTLRLSFEGRDPNPHYSLQWNLASGPVTMTIDSTGDLVWPTTFQDLDATRYVVELSDGIDRVPFRGIVFVNAPISIISAALDSAVVGQTYRYQVKTRDDNQGSLLKFRRPTVVSDIANTVAYEVNLQDDKFRRDLPRYLAQYRDLKNIFINKPRKPPAGEVAEAARIDLKQHVKHIFVEGDQLVVAIHNPEQGLIELEDVLWELFQGGRGIMPKYTAERVPFVHYSLREFPDGMTVDDDGLITWLPTFNQTGHHQLRLSVSDGYTRDEQSYQIYANYPPVIISQADTMAPAEQSYVYRVRVDDKNKEAHLTYRLTKHPEGMRIDSKGVVTWIPPLEQLNWQEFEIEVSDGHAVDRQATTVFVNMLPRVISQPKPVALNNYEYNYRVVAEDLNRDAIRYKATKLPRYSDFDPRTGLFRWRPRSLQKGPNDVAFEITDARGGVTIHEFQVHVFEDPSRRRFLFTGWPLLLAFVGMIFILGVTLT